MRGVVRVFKGLILTITIIVAAIIVLVPASSLLLETIGGSEGMSIIAEKIGLSEERIYEAPFHDYTFPGLGESITANIVSGIVGIIIVVVLTLALTLVFQRGTSWSSRKA